MEPYYQLTKIITCKELQVTNLPIALTFFRFGGRQNSRQLNHETPIKPLLDLIKAFNTEAVSIFLEDSFFEEDFQEIESLPLLKDLHLSSYS